MEVNNKEIKDKRKICNIFDWVNLKVKLESLKCKSIMDFELLILWGH